MNVSATNKYQTVIVNIKIDFRCCWDYRVMDESAICVNVSWSAS